MAIAAFFGPYRGLITMDSAATSQWTPLPLFVAYRLLVAVAFWAFAIYLRASGTPLNLLLFTHLNFVLQAFATSALAILSLLRVIGVGTSWYILPGIVTNWYQVYTTGALLGVVVYWSDISAPRVGERFAETTMRSVVVHAGTMVPVLLDFVLGGRVDFRVWGVLYAVAYVLLWIGFVAWPWWATKGQWIYGVLDPAARTTAGVVGVYFAIIALTLVCGMGLLVLSRFHRVAKSAVDDDDDDDEI